MTSQTNPRRYGTAPFRLVVVHGGPGAPGGMAPVARELASRGGVLEPLQTADSVQGQVEELRSMLKNIADGPYQLIGASWGAWLSLILAAQYPALVSKLILVGAGPFEEWYATDIMALRMSRLSPDDRNRAETLIKHLERAHADSGDQALGELGTLLSRTDAYDPVPAEAEAVQCDAAIYHKVWTEANELRRSGALLELTSRITIPVVAIHGDYDPHPSAGVREPLGRTLQDFRFIELTECGHEPWRERRARGPFFAALVAELGQVIT